MKPATISNFFFCFHCLYLTVHVVKERQALCAVMSLCLWVCSGNFRDISRICKPKILNLRFRRLCHRRFVSDDVCRCVAGLVFFP